MVSVTVSIPDDVKKLMGEFPEMNWSGFIRKSIVEKTEELKKKEKLLKILENEKEVIEWSIALQQKARKGRFEELKKKGLV